MISVTGDDIIVVQSVVARMVVDMVAAGIAVGWAIILVVVDSGAVGIEVVAMHFLYYFVFQLIQGQQQTCILPSSALSFDS